MSGTRRWLFLAGCAILASCTSGSPTSGPASTTSSQRQAQTRADLAEHTLAFMWGKGIFTANGDGSDRRLIAEVPGWYGGAHWSAAARAFITRVERETTDGELLGLVYKISADGSRVENLSHQNGGSTDTMVSWAPSGREIVFVSRREGDAFGQLYIMKSDGTSPRRLTQVDFEAQYPQWSPDGDHIAFAGVQGSQGENFDVFVVRPDGTELRRLTSSPSSDNWPTWAHDSSRIAYSVEDEIWMMDADGSDQHPVTRADQVSAGEPNWSPDGELIAFDCGTAETALICAVRPDGSGLKELFDRASFPFWIR